MMTKPSSKIDTTRQIENDVPDYILTLENRVQFLEQALSDFTAHFNNHGHSMPQDMMPGVVMSKPRQWRFPVFRPVTPSSQLSTAIQPPTVETEVKAVFMPNSKPQPIPQP
jgi:hypothetical protein